MKSSIYDIVNPENSTDIPDDATIRYGTDDAYIEIRTGDDELEIRCSGRFAPYLKIIPEGSNTIRIGMDDRYRTKK